MKIAGVIRQGGVLATLLVVLLSTTFSVFAADWGQWRQNELHTASHDQAVGLPLSQGWSREGYHYFSPAIAGGVVYLPRSTDSNTAVAGGGLVAYRLSDGQELWARTDLAVWGNAAVDGSIVVVGGSALYALNTSDGSTYRVYDETGTSDVIFDYPTVRNGIAYVWKRGTGLVAIELATGTKLWTASVGNAAGTPPIVTDEAIYAIGNFSTAARGSIWKLDPATGSVVWQRILFFFVNGGILVGDTVVAAGPVRTFGVDTATGTIRWFRNLSGAGMPVATESAVSVLHERSLTITDIRAYVISFDATLGPLSTDFGQEVGGRARGIFPVLADGQFIYSTEDGTIHVRDTSGEIGRFEGLDPVPLEFAAADGKLLAWNFLGQRLYTFGTSVGGPPVEEEEPILLVPGITASYNATVLENIPDANFHPISNWRFFLTGRLYYRQLINGLESTGLTEGEDFFIAHYDWRLPASQAAERYLEEWIDYVKQVTGKSKVDIVAHSYGGLVARAYIQSDRYINDVDQLIMIGTPNQGSAKAYTVWEGGELPKEFSWQLLDAYLWLIARTNNLDKFSYIRQSVQSVKNLLPTSDHVMDLSTGTYVPFLGMFENNLAIASLNESQQILLDRAHVSTGAGRNSINKTIQVVNVPYHGYGFDGLHWIDGQPDPNNPYVHTLEGDGTVLISSAQLTGSKLLPILAGGHVGLTNTYADLILLELGYDAGTAPLISPNQVVNFVFASPLTVRITDPEGRALDTATGENNIPGSEFIQEEWMKMVAIPEPVAGDYRVALTGTGDGEYHGLVSLVDDVAEAVTEDEIQPGFITTGQTIPYIASVPEEATDPISLEIDDTTPPTINFDPVPDASYLHNQSFAVGLNITDDLPGVASTALTLDGNPILEDVPIDLFYLALGNHEIVASATDVAGNRAEIRHAFHVGASIESTISDLERIYQLGWITKYSTFLKLRYSLEVLHRVDESPIPELYKIAVKKIILKNFLRLLAIEKNNMTAQVYQILYDDARYLLEHL